MEETFRQFYNHTIYPELYRMERRRKRLLMMLAGMGVLSVLVLSIGFVLKMNALILFLLLPLVGYFSWLGRALRQYVKLFKPRIVKLILDFIDNQLSYDTLHYEPEKGISKKMFLESGLFVTKADDYQSEDYISGKIGDVAFELSEIRARELAGQQSGTRLVFSGVFFKATFNRPVRGAILIIPRHERARMNKVIKKFNLKGGKPVVLEGMDEFNERFLIYRTLNASISMAVSKAFCESILNYYQMTKESPAVLISGEGAYAVLPSSKDMLEPKLFSSNLKFEEIDEFYRDLNMLLELIEELDRMF